MFKSTIFLTIAAALFVNAAPLDRRTLFVCAIDPQPIETGKPVIIARSPIVLPPGSKPIDSDPNLPIHAFKRCTILPEALPIETEPESQPIETEKPVIIARRSPALSEPPYDPDMPMHILRGDLPA